MFTLSLNIETPSVSLCVHTDFDAAFEFNPILTVKSRSLIEWVCL